jgi:hypothetical protein
MASDYEAQLRECYAALNRRDFDAFADFFHPRVEARSVVMESEGTVYRGIDGMRSFAEDLVGVFPDWHGDIQEVAEVGRGVAVRIAVSGTAAGSGVPVEWLGFAAVEFQDGLPIKALFVRTEDEAHAALRRETG